MAAPTTTVLEVRSLLKRFRGPSGASTTVVDVPAFSLAAGEQVAIRGASGSGKTTFLNLIAGISTPDAGVVEIAGHDLTALRPSQRDRVRARHVGYVFQTFNLLQGYTALENVLAGMMFGRGTDEPFARDLLCRVGLADRLHHQPKALSVGQQQRVAVARALAGRPDLVLADEPTGNLDARRASEAMAMIRTLCRAQDAALLVVSHSPAILRRFDTVLDFAQLNRAAREVAA
ncbi:MAG: ABC transporter ATP-binding protein [Nannocystaceae bacterium]|nr:ABC transporter ATP-binding protein [bacterium]